MAKNNTKVCSTYYQQPAAIFVRRNNGEHNSTSTVHKKNELFEFTQFPYFVKEHVCKNDGEIETVSKHKSEIWYRNATGSCTTALSNLILLTGKNSPEIQI